MKKIPIWELLVKAGYFDDKKTAEAWIMAGNVLVNESRVVTSGQMVNPTDHIRIKGYNQKYVSKGGIKLEGALNDFCLNVEGVIAIDAGASTGGFTDCLLQHGASLVYAVDVGFGQLAGKLRANPNVINLEKVNISEIDPNSLNPKPSLATVDLSYLSLKKAIPIFANILQYDGELLCLVKPLFEVADSNIRRAGNIEDISIYRDLLIDLFEFTNGCGYPIIGITYSHVTGNSGTREFFLKISLRDEKSNYDFTQFLIDIEKSIDCVMKIDIYKKS